MKLLSSFCTLSIIGLASASVRMGEHVAHPADGYRLAKRVPQSLTPRVSFYGGWALSATTCPSGTDVCGEAAVGFDPNACCPTGTNCQTSTGERFCCPDTGDCSQKITSLPVCADASWSMWVDEFGFFCCLGTQQGVLNGLYFGVCADSDVGVPASQRASSATQVGAATATSGAKTTSKAGTSATGTRTAAATSSTATGLISSLTHHSGAAKIPAGAIVGIVVGAVVLLSAIGIAG